MDTTNFSILHYPDLLDEDIHIDEETLSFLNENMQGINEYSIPTLICGILMIVVAVGGIIGNAFNVYIFSMRSMGVASISILLTGISTVDGLLLLVSAPLFASSAIYVYRPSFSLMTFVAYLTSYVYPCASTLQTASVWLMTLATLERWIAVCQPFLARTLCTRKRARRTVFLVLVLSFAYNACRFWEYRPTPVGQGTAMMALPLLRENKHYIHIYVHWMYVIFLFGIPFIMLSAVNGMVVLTIRKARQNRRNLTRQQRKEHATAALMVIVAFVFMTCNSLAFVLNALELWGASGVHDVELPTSDPSDFYPSINRSSRIRLLFDSLYANLTNVPEFTDHSNWKTAPRHSNFFYFLIDLNNLLVMIHCSVNFLIYYNFSQRYRTHVQVYIFGQKILRDGAGEPATMDSLQGARTPRYYEDPSSRCHYVPIEGYENRYNHYTPRRSFQLLVKPDIGNRVKYTNNGSSRNSIDIGANNNEIRDKKHCPLDAAIAFNSTFLSVPKR